jgi:hypothetical protein
LQGRLAVTLQVRSAPALLARSEAIRRLVELGLKGEGEMRDKRLPKQAVHPRPRTQLHNGLAQSLQRQFGLPQLHGKNWLGSRAVQPSASECASVAASLARASTAVNAIGLKVVKNASITVDRIAATLRDLNLVIVESIHVVDPRGLLIERLASDFRYSRAREIVKSRSSAGASLHTRQQATWDY